MVQLHHSSPGGDAEDPGAGIAPARECKDLFFDSRRHPRLPIDRIHDQPAVRNILSITPGLYIRESRPSFIRPIHRNSNDGLPFINFLTEGLRRTPGYARSPL